MKFLGLDTTRKKAKIYIINEQSNNVLSMDENVKHSEGLFLYLEKALLESKLIINDFDYLSAVVGPGSFTGIRVGMSVIKGFNAVINKQIVTINIFEILKYKYRNHTIILNSTSTSCYYAKIKSGDIIDSGVVNKSDIENVFANEKIIALKEEENLLKFDNANIQYVGQSEFDELYFEAILKKVGNEDMGVFEPYYLQLSQAERNVGQN